MKIEIELLGMKDGKPTELEFEDTIYEVRPKGTTINTVKAKRTYKKRKHKREILGYDKTYSMQITYDDSQKVRNAIMNTEKDFIPTTEAIVKETGLPLNRVRATIHLLKKRGVIKSKSGKDRQTVHRLINKQQIDILE